MFDHPDGEYVTNPLRKEELANQGYRSCANHYCDFHVSPETQQDNYDTVGPKGRYNCAVCNTEQSLHKSPGSPGGGTNSGLHMDAQRDIGEHMVRDMGNIPGYGQIVWWSQAKTSALDGATSDWGIEVKTYNWSNARPRGIINPADKVTKARAINDPALFAKEMNDPKLDAILHRLNFKGLLGVLVLLDFDTELADVFAHEMPKSENGILTPKGVKHITRKVVLAEGVPFNHDLPKPHEPGFVPAYQQQTVEQHEPF